MFSDDSLRRVQRTGKFVVGVDPNGAPYSFLAGEMKGIDVDLAQAIAERLGVAVDIVRLYFDWPAMVNQLDERKVDAIITCVSITEERKQQVAFVEYAHDPFVFTVRSDSPPIRTRADLGGKVLVVQQGTAAERIAERMKREGPDFTIRVRETMPDTFAAVRDKKVDAVLEHRRIAAYHAGLGGPKLDIHQPDGIDPALADQRLGIALRRDAKELHAAVEKAVADLKADGTLQRILDKWEPR
jgi:polar amino acid transport system substrate-binding protein